MVRGLSPEDEEELQRLNFEAAEDAWSMPGPVAADNPEDLSAWLDDRVERFRRTEEGKSYRRTTWWPEDLADAVGGGLPPTPSILERSDGAALLYEGKSHTFFGEHGSMKSRGALMAVRDRLLASQDVFYIDCESDRRSVCRQLLEMGVTPAVILRRFHYIRPEQPLDDRRFGRFAKFDLGVVGDFFDVRLIVIDGVSEFMAIHGLDANDAGDVARYGHLLFRSPLRGVTRLSVDHIAKGGGTEGKPSPIGSQHKVAGIDGAAYFFRAVAQEGVGGVSRSSIFVWKDRDGMVFPICDPPERYGLVGELRVGPTVDSHTPCVILSPADGAAAVAEAKAEAADVRIAEDAEKFINALRNTDANQTEKVGAVTGLSKNRAHAAARRLEETGRIARDPGVRKNPPWTVVPDA
jgi:hypothetical protein